MAFKPHSLRLQRDFEEIRKKGKNISSPLFNLKFLPNDLKLVRFAIVISKKISKKAVDRNNLRRKVRPQLQELIKTQAIATGYDLVFYAKIPALKALKESREKTIRYLLHQAKLLK